MQSSLPDASYFNWVVQMQNVADGWEKLLGKTDALILIENGNLELHCDQTQWRRMGKRLLHKIVTEPDWFSHMLKKTGQHIDEYFVYLKKFRRLRFSTLSNAELAERLMESTEGRRTTHFYGVLGTILEFDHELFSNYLRNYIREQIKKTGIPANVNEVFATLTIFNRDTIMRKEEINMLRLAGMKNQKVTRRALAKHTHSFCWLPYQYRGPAWDENYFKEILESLLRQHIDTKAELQKFARERRRQLQKQRELEKVLRFDAKHCNLFVFARELGFLKAERNDSFFFSYYCAELLLREIGKRLSLSFDQVRLFLPGEAEVALKTGTMPTDELNERYRLSAYYFKAGHGRMLVGEKARHLIHKIRKMEPQLTETKELHGTVAVSGIVKGFVKIVNKTEDMRKMEQGNILVSNATYPSLVPAMKKAAAIVTDLGGITCHAAIISRELQIPCVVGTKIATRILKDGDIVEVDATTGVVRKI